MDNTLIIVGLSAGVVLSIGYLAICAINPREYDNKLEGRPTEPPPPPTVITSPEIKPRMPGIYRTQYTTHGLLVTEYKFWDGEKWCDTVQRNYVSPFQTRTWEML